MYVETQNERTTASEGLTDLLAVYMPNKVLLHDGNSSKISLGLRGGGGGGVKVMKRERLECR